MFDPSELEELEKALAKASAGPWTQSASDDDTILDGKYRDPLATVDSEVAEWPDNLAAITLAINFLRASLPALKALSVEGGENERLREALRKCVADLRSAHEMLPVCPGEATCGFIATINASEAALSSPASDGWMDISTAPKDGTRLLAFQRGRESQMYECWWQEDFAHWSGWQDDWDNEPAPTHYRPLPAPPAIEKEPT